MLEGERPEEAGGVLDFSRQCQRVGTDVDRPKALPSVFLTLSFRCRGSVSLNPVILRTLFVACSVVAFSYIQDNYILDLWPVVSKH